MVISTGKLRAHLEDAKMFAQEEFPLLLPRVKRNIEDIEQLYIDAGQPDGPDRSFEWLEKKFVTWQHKQEISSSEVRDEVAKAMADAVALGDVKSDGTYAPMPKSVARHLLMQLMLMVNKADEDLRGLNEEEEFALVYLLMFGLAHM